MSRVRFHSIRAIFNRNDVKGIYTGPGWSNWDENKSCQYNIDSILNGRDCSMIICYKPLDIKGFDKVTYKKCIRYNEMFDIDWTIKEIKESKCNYVICHHYNDFTRYNNIFSTNRPPSLKGMAWIAHCADNKIFKPRKEIKKIYDIAIVGATHASTILGNAYPLRYRMTKVLNKIPSKYVCKVIPHVGGSHPDAHTDKYAIDFANKINSAKIIVTDSAVTKYRLGKYIEVPMCGTALAGDIYDDHINDIKNLKKFLIEINMQMSDDQIIDILTYYIDNETKRQEKINLGLNYTKNYTQNHYADKFIDFIKTLQ